MSKGLKKETQPIEITFLKSPIFSYILLAIAIIALLAGFFFLFIDGTEQKDLSFSPIAEGCIEEIEIKGQIVSYELRPSLFGGEDFVVSSLDIKEQIKRAEKNKKSCTNK
ncbi:MAG: hypothetical protein N3D10_02000 [Candidatus Micrarchaeota archaeon]|nr:hypothetical protein [Candidatus Micrarchaeota archaeon]